MWNWFNCYLSGRHDYGMWCEPGAIFLRCMHCGRRSPGWSVHAKSSDASASAAEVTTATTVPAAARSAQVLPFDRHAPPRRADIRVDTRLRRRNLTASAWADHNTRRARSPHQQRRSETASRQRRAAGRHRRAAEVPVRTQHGQAARRAPVSPKARSRCRRDREIVVYDSDPNELASSHVAAELIRLRLSRGRRSRAASTNGCPPICRPKPNRRR